VLVNNSRIHSSVKYRCSFVGAGDSCDGEISVLYNCLSWYKFVNTHLYHSRQLYNIFINVVAVRDARWKDVIELVAERLHASSEPTNQRAAACLQRLASSTDHADSAYVHLSSSSSSLLPWEAILY